MPSKSLSRRSLMGTAALGVAQLGSAVAPPASEKPAPSIIPTKLESSEKLKVAILGCGKRSGAHIRAISHYEDIEISALCDILPEKMEEKKKSEGSIRGWVPSWEDISSFQVLLKYCKSPVSYKGEMRSGENC